MRTQKRSIWIPGLVLLAMMFLNASLPAIASSATASASTPSASAKEAATPTAAQRARTRVEDRAAKESVEEDSEVNIYRHSSMVKTLAHMFGLSTEVTARIFEIINFIILAAAILWFVLRALPKALRNRSEHIQKDLVNARQATEDASRRLQDVEQRLSRLDGEIASLKAQAEQQTVNDEARIRAAMEEEKERLVHAAEQEITSVSANAQRRLKTLAADLIVEYAAHHVSLDSDTDRSLIHSFVSELSSNGHKGEGRN